MTISKNDQTLRFSKSSVLTVAALIIMCSNANADHRFAIGWSQWAALDEFDVGSYKVSYEFGEIERAWNIRIGLTGFYSENDEYFAGIGATKEWSMSPKWSWGIALDAGYFSGDALGDEVEFYTRALLNWHVSQSGFLRLEFGHISNAGFGTTNPGSENLGLTYNWSF
ncbi:MAG: acyloxyacyl hydrolase [Woeseiaceae bacterium]